ncbi:glycosyltransferase family 2 protein [Methyloligella sp. 2.7D]|uniref:glycosyltransferase family 2 protein n=1 Tax=unclassified Methyloligella TaxID=2625955 RepID=UPI00157C5886|nr:glycosyltransferase family 2 protein [Methyloligella sp. GL2]QKP78441.1 glycosyltransferase family 2 protein [Methyloligella sp. GL2]
MEPLPAELSIIIPTRNERGNIEPIVARLTRALQGIRWEVIFVDDDSQDGTIAAVREIARRDPRIRGIRRIKRRGLAGAVIEGMLSSSAPLVAVMDGDLQHDPAVLPRMLQMLKGEDADLVVATRQAGESTGEADAALSPDRQRFSDLANSLARRLLHVELSDPMSGFFMIRRGVVEQVAPRLSNQGFKILLDIVASAPRDLRIRECEYQFAPRLAGESKLDLVVSLEYLGLLLAKLTDDRLPVRFIMFGLVGGSGVAINIVALWGLLSAGMQFALAQFSATMLAMLSNYLLNNALTYRDRRRHGWRLLTGFASFAMICGVGVVANVGLATLIYQWDTMWLLAGLAGALVGSIWNYAATSVVTWRE